MRMNAAILLSLVCAWTLASARPSDVYDVGPAYRFEPDAGDEANLVSFSNGYTIDTRLGEPQLPGDLRLSGAPAERVWRVVQFQGPIRQEWLRNLRRLHVQPVGYLPNHAVVAQMDGQEAEAAAGLPMVRWVGLFQPAYKIEAGLLERAGLSRVVILLWPGERPDALAALGLPVEEILSTAFGTTLTLTTDAQGIKTLARLQPVQWVQRFYEAKFQNDNAQWVCQTGWRASAPTPTDTAARRVWTRGVRGQRVILSTTDSGLNTGHDLFRDPGLSITPPGIWPNHRKVVAFKLYGTADAGENPYHGSHVNGTVAGDDSATGGTSYYDGMSIKARLYFTDISNASGALIVPSDLTPVWDTVHLGRGLPDSVRPIWQHSGSWGSSNSSGTYTIMDASTDAYCWAHKDFLNIFSAGNDGSGATTIGNPGIAKNVVTVGACGNGTSSNTLAGFSSRGPTQDNRIKPTLCAPGVGLVSASPSPSTNGYSSMSGTSMACPAASSTIGLLRCYLKEGYYPSGTAQVGDRLSYISAALLRSMAAASTDPNVGAYTVPSFDIGWGRIDADSVLYFAGETRKLIIRDDTTGIATGEYRQLQFWVNSSIPLRVALAWTDTAAAPSANPTLVNDLNLELTSPGGTVYRGNQYSGGQSQANPPGWDNRNTEECARINSPATGVWTLKVLANQVSTAARQPFGFAITGDVAGSTMDVGVTRVIAPTGTVDSTATVTPQARVKNFGAGPATFPVTMRIAPGYANTQTVTNLAPGDSATVSFTNWIATARGTYAVRCSTGLVGDQDAANDTLSGSVTVRVLNVGVTAILAPTGTVDSNTLNTPRARVKNFGSNAVTFPVSFYISGGYANTQTVTNLAAGDSATVNFANWTAGARGTYTTRCTTALTGDLVASNDVATGSVTVRVVNVGVSRIIAPTGTLDSGTAVSPQAKVVNPGSSSATFLVNMRIGALYNNSQTVTNLASGDSATVTFVGWSALPRGLLAVRCTTSLSGDVYKPNDTLSGSVTVRVTNVGVTQIIGPTGTHDSGEVLTPSARIRNFGTGAATFTTTFRIGAFYSNTQTVTALAAGDSATVNFAAWPALQRGTHTTRCTTALTGDQVPANNALSGSVTIRVPGDVGVSRIIAPAGTVDSAVTVTPQAVVMSYGGTAPTFPVTLRIGTLYTNTQNVSGLAGGDSVVVSFANWTPGRRGTYAVGCTTAMAGDTVPANNGASGSVTVRVQDVGVIGISSPSGMMEPGRVATPAATVCNYGSVSADFTVWMLLDNPSGQRVYSASVAVAGLAAGATRQVNTFPPCTLRTRGDWTAKCSTVMAGDVKPANDVFRQGFKVQSFWAEVSSMPLPVSGRSAKDGAWLAYCEGNRRIYAAKGNKTADFYSYNTSTDAWSQHQLIPYGGDGALPYKGSSGCTDGSRYVYMAKGANTLGFWRYDIQADTWQARALVPAGANKVKAGADAVFALGYVYLLKGRGAEFCRYDTQADSWQTLSPAPAGISPKYDNGSFLVYDGANTIYVHKAKNHELWAFDIATRAWKTDTLRAMPYLSASGRTKKAKDGSSGAWVTGSIYAFKGGNTNEFWRYAASSDLWTESDTIPTFGSTGRLRRIKAGGDIANAGGTLYALKGNKTVEFWRYAPGALVAPEPRVERDGVTADRIVQGGWQVRLSPNPLTRDIATLSFTRPPESSTPRPLTASLIDPSGRVVRHLGVQHGETSVRLDLRGLSAGVYLLKLDSGSASFAQPLILQK